MKALNRVEQNFIQSSKFSVYHNSIARWRIFVLKTRRLNRDSKQRMKAKASDMLIIWRQTTDFHKKMHLLLALKASKRQRDAMNLALGTWKARFALKVSIAVILEKQTARKYYSRLKGALGEWRFKAHRITCLKCKSKKFHAILDYQITSRVMDLWRTMLYVKTRRDHLQNTIQKHILCSIIDVWLKKSAEKSFYYRKLSKGLSLNRLGTILTIYRTWDKFSTERIELRRLGNKTYVRHQKWKFCEIVHIWKAHIDSNLRLLELRLRVSGICKFHKQRTSWVRWKYVAQIENSLYQKFKKLHTVNLMSKLRTSYLIWQEQGWRRKKIKKNQRKAIRTLSRRVISSWFRSFQRLKYLWRLRLQICQHRYRSLFKSTLNCWCQFTLNKSYILKLAQSMIFRGHRISMRNILTAWKISFWTRKTAVLFSENKANTSRKNTLLSALRYWHCVLINSDLIRKSFKIVKRRATVGVAARAILNWFCTIQLKQKTRNHPHAKNLLGHTLSQWKIAEIQRGQITSKLAARWNNFANVHGISCNIILVRSFCFARVDLKLLHRVAEEWATVTINGKRLALAAKAIHRQVAHKSKHFVFTCMGALILRQRHVNLQYERKQTSINIKIVNVAFSLWISLVEKNIFFKRSGDIIQLKRCNIFRKCIFDSWCCQYVMGKELSARAVYLQNRIRTHIFRQMFAGWLDFVGFALFWTSRTRSFGKQTDLIGLAFQCGINHHARDIASRILSSLMSARIVRKSVAKWNLHVQMVAERIRLWCKSIKHRTLRLMKWIYRLWNQCILSSQYRNRIQSSIYWATRRKLLFAFFFKWRNFKLYFGIGKRVQKRMLWRRGESTLKYWKEVVHDSHRLRHLAKFISRKKSLRTHLNVFIALKSYRNGVFLLDHVDATQMIKLNAFGHKQHSSRSVLLFFLHVLNIRISSTTRISMRAWKSATISRQNFQRAAEYAIQRSNSHRTSKYFQAWHISKQLKFEVEQATARSDIFNKKMVSLRMFSAWATHIGILKRIKVFQNNLQQESQLRRLKSNFCAWTTHFEEFQFSFDNIIQRHSHINNRIQFNSFRSWSLQKQRIRKHSRISCQLQSRSKSRLIYSSFMELCRRMRKKSILRQRQGIVFLLQRTRKINDVMYTWKMVLGNQYAFKKAKASTLCDTWFQLVESLISNYQREHYFKCNGKASDFVKLAKMKSQTLHRHNRMICLLIIWLKFFSQFERRQSWMHNFDLLLLFSEFSRRVVPVFRLFIRLADTIRYSDNFRAWNSLIHALKFANRTLYNFRKAKGFNQLRSSFAFWSLHKSLVSRAHKRVNALQMKFTVLRTGLIFVDWHRNCNEQLMHRDEILTRFTLEGLTEMKSKLLGAWRMFKTRMCNLRQTARSIVTRTYSLQKLQIFQGWFRLTGERQRHHKILETLGNRRGMKLIRGPFRRWTHASYKQAMRERAIHIISQRIQCRLLSISVFQFKLTTIYQFRFMHLTRIARKLWTLNRLRTVIKSWKHYLECGRFEITRALLKIIWGDQRGISTSCLVQPVFNSSFVSWRNSTFWRCVKRRTVHQIAAKEKSKSIQRAFANWKAELNFVVLLHANGERTAAAYSRRIGSKLFGAWAKLVSDRFQLLGQIEREENLQSVTLVWKRMKMWESEVMYRRQLDHTCCKILCKRQANMLNICFWKLYDGAVEGKIRQSCR